MTPVPGPADAVRLRGEIGRERRSLAEAAARVAEARARSAAPEASWIERAALGKALDDVYQGTERILRSIARAFEGLPGGPDWHVDLLENMRAEMPGMRPPVISMSTAPALRDLLGFRHRFRNLYGADLDPGRLDDLAGAVPGALEALGRDLASFDAFLESLAAASSG